MPSPLAPPHPPYFCTHFPPTLSQHKNSGVQNWQVGAWKSPSCPLSSRCICWGLGHPLPPLSVLFLVPFVSLVPISILDPITFPSGPIPALLQPPLEWKAVELVLGWRQDHLVLLWVPEPVSPPPRPCPTLILHLQSGVSSQVLETRHLSRAEVGQLPCSRGPGTGHRARGRPSPPLSRVSVLWLAGLGGAI